MPTPVAIDDIQDLFTSIETSMGLVMEKQDSIEEDLCVVRRGKRAKRIKFWFSPVQNTEEVWPRGKDRKTTPASLFSTSVQNQRQAPKDEEVYYDDLNEDTYEVLAGKGQKIVSRSRGMWRRMLARWLATSKTTLSYDKVPFYSTSHPVNPARPGFGPNNGVYSNYLQNCQLNKAGLIRALQQLLFIPGWDGELLNADDSKLIVTVGSVQQEINAKELLRSAQIAVPVGANAAVAVQNQLVDRAEVRLFKEMGRYLPGAWTLSNVSDPVNRPYAISKAREPEFHYSGLQANEEIRRRRGAISIGWDANGGVGPGLPQLSVLCEE